MKICIDPHCHTLASGHAYSTIMENAAQAAKKGLSMMAVTDHGPRLPGASHVFTIRNLQVVPPRVFGVEILKGVEANILTPEGELDVPDEILKELDIVLAGLHEIVISPADPATHTTMLLKVMDNPLVDVFVHPGNPNFYFDYEKVLARAKEKNVLIEINNSSLGVSRKGSRGNCKRIAELCRDMDVPIVVGSDAHIAFDVGEFSRVLALLEETTMPERLVMNSDPAKFRAFLRAKGKKRFQ